MVELHRKERHLLSLQEALDVREAAVATREADLAAREARIRKFHLLQQQRKQQQQQQEEEDGKQLQPGEEEEEEEEVRVHMARSGGLPEGAGHPNPLSTYASVRSAPVGGKADAAQAQAAVPQSKLAAGLSAPSLANRGGACDSHGSRGGADGATAGTERQLLGRVKVKEEVEEQEEEQEEEDEEQQHQQPKKRKRKRARRKKQGQQPEGEMSVTPDAVLGLSALQQPPQQQQQPQPQQQQLPPPPIHELDVKPAELLVQFLVGQLLQQQEQQQQGQQQQGQEGEGKQARGEGKAGKRRRSTESLLQRLEEMLQEDVPDLAAVSPLCRALHPAVPQSAEGSSALLCSSLPCPVRLGACTELHLEEKQKGAPVICGHLVEASRQ
eukprot:jgi/Mesen1/5929/ME000301S05064